MLASHAALCWLTGNSEILVFHTLSAGNMGQFGAPGTALAVTGAVAVAGAVAVTGVAVRGAAVTLVMDPAPHPGADAATTAPTAIQRPTWHLRDFPAGQ